MIIDKAKLKALVEQGSLPPIISALIEEIERLEGSVQSLIQMERNTGNRALEYAGKCDQLRAEVAGLKTGYEAYERVNAELKQKVANLEVCQTASLGMSGIIKCVAGELGFDTAGEDSAQDYLIGLARKASELKAENEALRESEQEATDLCDTLSALLGQIAVAVRGPEEPKSRHGFSDLPSRVKTVVSDCSKLKGESVALLKALDVAAARMVAAKACFDRDYPGKWSGELHLAVAIKEIEAALGQGEQS